MTTGSIPPPTTPPTVAHDSTGQLKPCPFCGGRNLDDTCQNREEGGARRQFFFIYCNLCQACGPTDFKREDAIEQWNLRSDGGEV